MPAVQVLVNNRKVVEGFARGLGLDDVDAVLRSVDKLDKIGPAAVAELLTTEAGATADEAAAVLELAEVRGSEASVVDRVRDLAARHGAGTELLETGLSELAQLLEAADRAAPGVLVADLKIARGLDYYTGSVYETVLVGHEHLGSICSGGRYDSLASDGSTTYPGVGISVGVSRLVSRLLSAELVTVTRTVPSAVLVAVTDEPSRPESERVAAALRSRGIPVEVAPTAAKFGKQIRHADRRGVPYVWFCESGEVKDIRSGDQVPADPATWEPPAEDWWPRVVAAV
jgi:histidyl-tRNA synthetase